jgi:class 3 adenylate cyclase
MTMTDNIEQIKKTIAALEAQRSLLGDAVVDTALAPLREQLASLQPQPGSEQRKLVTVLFADLVGFTSMSEKMDPEDVREIVNSYFTLWSASIEKYGGVVEKFIGDAVMAVFGLTVAREDDPENAIRAALDMRQALTGLNEELKLARGLHLVMRTGIHTGLAIISLLDDRQARKEDGGFVAVGDTVNLASRLQNAAPEGSILISHDTYRLVQGVFDIQMQDPVQVKGKQEPIQVYLVLRAKQRTFHAPSRGVEGVETSMIGRDAELQQLKDALSAAMERRKTQVIVVTGEAGIGKSRLIAEFDNWLELLPQVIRSSSAGPALRWKICLTRCFEI